MSTSGIKKYIKKAEEETRKMLAYRKHVKSWKFDTIAVHGMYSVEESLSECKGGIIEPIFASSSQAYRDSDEMEAGLSYQIPTWCYSRIHNPTVFYLEETLALLETYGTSLDATGLCTSSGMAAIKQAIEPLIELKDDRKPVNFVSAAQVYGGTFQLFNLRMRERGAYVRWISEPWNIELWEKNIDENTRFLYTEMPSNPQQSCCDLKIIAELAHKWEIPFIVDTTIATPALMRPIEFGADIVIHSLTKTIGSAGTSIGGAVIAKHNIICHHLPEEVKTDYALWLKLWPFRDCGPTMSAGNAYYFLNDIKSLRVKVAHFSRNTLKVANFLSGHTKIERVDYLGLEDHFLHPIARKYMKLADSDEHMFGHLMSFNVKSTAKDTRNFFDKLKMIYRATDLGRIKSVATIPAISTHQQQGDEGRELAGIPFNLVRLCVGGENPDDVISDLDQALR